MLCALDAHMSGFFTVFAVEIILPCTAGYPKRLHTYDRS